MSSEVSFSSGDYDQLDRYGSCGIGLSALEMQTDRVAQDAIKPLNVGGSGEVKIEIKWGSDNGPSYSVGASGEVHDNRGNYVKAEVQQDNNGQGSAAVSAGHKAEQEGQQ